MSVKDPTAWAAQMTVRRLHERIRALEAEVKKWDEDAQEWAEAMAREKVRADALEAELAIERAENEAYRKYAYLKSDRGAMPTARTADDRDALKARVAELEKFLRELTLFDLSITTDIRREIQKRLTGGGRESGE